VRWALHQKKIFAVAINNFDDKLQKTQVCQTSTETTHTFYICLKTFIFRLTTQQNPEISGNNKQHFSAGFSTIQICETKTTWNFPSIDAGPFFKFWGKKKSSELESKI
jgi:hypothetical protein